MIQLSVVLMSLSLTNVLAADVAETSAAETSVAETVGKAVREHVAATQQEEGNDGLYPLEDLVIGKNWMLRFEGVDPSGARIISSKERIVRVAFVAPAAANETPKDFKVVADFTLILEGADWAVYDEAVYSVDGVIRFAYNAKNERVDPRAPQEADEEDSEEEGASPAEEAPAAKDEDDGDLGEDE